MRRLVVSICALVAVCFTACEAEHKPFDKQVWSKGDYRERGRMYRDLEKRHPLKGLSVDEVKSLIGEPNDLDTAAQIMTWHLDLGWTALFHMDLHVDHETQRIDSIRVWD